MGRHRPRRPIGGRAIAIALKLVLASLASCACVPVLAVHAALAEGQGLVDTVGARQRMQCIARTHPVFDPNHCGDGWDCKVYLPQPVVTVGGALSECRCCME